MKSDRYVVPVQLFFALQGQESHDWTLFKEAMEKKNVHVIQANEGNNSIKWHKI